MSKVCNAGDNEPADVVEIVEGEEGIQILSASAGSAEYLVRFKCMASARWLGKAYAESRGSSIQFTPNGAKFRCSEQNLAQHYGWVKTRVSKTSAQMKAVLAREFAEHQLRQKEDAKNNDVARRAVRKLFGKDEGGSGAHSSSL